MNPPAEAPATLGAVDVLLVRYGELSLKGGNRIVFERALMRNIRDATAPIAAVRVERLQGRLLVFPEARVEEVARRLQDVFGIASISPAWSAPGRPEAIAELASKVLARALAGKPTDRRIPFRIATSRADKSFPMVSPELDRYVADRVLGPFEQRVEVRLKHAELVLGIDVRPERTYVYAERLEGPRGLPVGTLGRALCLLSGGIDSPVAAWLSMKRGCLVSFVSFHSYPYIGESSKRKIRRLVEALGRYQHESVLFSVPFTEIQESIRDNCPAAYRTVLYRRMMQRIASRVARRQRAQVLITGESLGQVASQTMENLTCIEAASELPVLRPLISYDKLEAIDLARRIGTLDISNRPEPDCCTVFQPQKPIIRGKLDVCLDAETLLDVEALVERALDGTERIEVSPAP